MTALPGILPAQTSTAPRASGSVTWKYRHMAGVGDNIAIEFAEPDYKITAASAALLNAAVSPPAPVRPVGDFIPYRPVSSPFKDLEVMITSNIHYNTLPVKVQVDYLRVTGATDLALIAVDVQKSDLIFRADGGSVRADVNIFALPAHRGGSCPH